MAVRTLGGIARSSVSDWKEFPFAGCDVAAPVPFVLVGGGNRQRRRVHGAVGPERTNDLLHSRDFSNAAWTKSNASLTPGVTDPFGGTTAYTLTATGGGYGVLQQVLSAGASTLRVNSVWLRRRTGTGNINHWSPDGATPLIIGGLTAAWQRFDAPNAAAGTGRTFVIEIVTPGDEIDVWEAQLESGAVSTPNITTGASPVTTTDWPRRTLNGNGTTPQYGGGGWWSTDGTGDLGPSNVLGPTGYPMSKLARRSASDGCYAYQSGLTFIAGEKYARRIVAQADDDAGDLVFVEMATSPGVYIANGHINVRTGAVPTVSNGTITLMGQIGKQFIFEMRGTAPATTAAGYVSWIVPFAGAVGTGVLVGCDQTELGEVCTAHMHSGLGQYGSAVTPPFGQLVDVDAGKPRIEYGADGFGRGVMVEGGVQQLFHKTDFSSGWGFNPGGVSPGRFHLGYRTPDGYPAASLTTAIGYFSYLSGQSPNVTNGLTYYRSLCVKPLSAVQDVHFEWSGVWSYPLFRLTDGYVSHAGCWIEELEDGWYRLNQLYTVPQTGVSCGAVYFDAAGPAARESSFIIAKPMLAVSVGPQSFISNLTADALTAPAESLETFDLQALDLHNGRGTILVDFIMPEHTSGALHGILSLCTADAGVWLGIYSNGDGVHAACYYGGSRYNAAFGPFVKGDRVRAALTFDTGYFASAVNGVPGAVTYGNNPIAYDRVLLGDMDGPRNRPADTTISLAATTGRVAITDDLCEATRI